MNKQQEATLTAGGSETAEIRRDNVLRERTTYLVSREDAGVQLHVSRLVHAVHVSERRCDAEVRGHGSEGLLYSPDLAKQDAKNTGKEGRRFN